MSAESLLKVKNLTVKYNLGEKQVIALESINLEIKEREIFALVGESGSGKSTLGLSLLGLLPFNSRVKGEIYFRGEELLSSSGFKLAQIRGKFITMVFQEPAASFNPVYSVGFQIEEVLRFKLGIKNKKERKKKILELFSQVGLGDSQRLLSAYPYELSGGMLQRVMIAQAIATTPRLLIADEPTSSLDVTIESQILNLFLKLRDKYNLSILFITHDLDVAQSISDRICVLKKARIEEMGDKEEILTSPRTPYTRKLIESFRILGV